MPLFSLLIGINNYHPESNVPALLGCANDVEAVESFLESQFKVEDLNAVSLIDEAATYDNIIKHFGAAHLAKAKKGDTVFIHFSGHGARGFSAPEFKAYFPDGLDENLVCYDSRVGANYDLADKELAVLIERIAVKGVDVIVLLDCCHSGSGTRSSEELEIAAAREWEDREEVRSLESYLNRYFVNNLYVPNSRHLLLAACEKREKAFELSNNQGVFTNSILQVLKEKNGQISYSNLFAETRSIMRKLSKKQTPQFEPFGKFNVHWQFLNRKESNGSNYPLLMENGDWIIHVGALQGLGVLPEGNDVFAIYENGKEIGTAKTRSVDLSSSVVDADVNLDASKTYQARLLSIPKPPIVVALETSTSDIGKLDKALDEYKPIYFELAQEGPAAPYKILIGNKGVEILRTEDKLSLGKLPDLDKFAYLAILKRLDHICRWEKSRRLGKEISQKNSDVKLLLEMLDDKNDVIDEFSKNRITIALETKDGITQKQKYRLKVLNNSKKEKHIALLHFTQNYGVYSVYNEAVVSNYFVIVMEKNERGFAHNFHLKKKTAAKEYFKLIVSNKKIDSHLLSQKEIDLKKIEFERGAGKRKVKGANKKESWYVIDMEVHLTL